MKARWECRLNICSRWEGGSFAKHCRNHPYILVFFPHLEPQPFKHSTMLRKILKCLTNFPMFVLSRGSGKPNQSINHRAQSFNTLIMTIQQSHRIMLLNFLFTQWLKWNGLRSITVIKMKSHWRLDIR